MSHRVFTQTFGIVGAIIEKDGKFLLVKEATGPSKGKWNQPAGWPDTGEDLLKAVAREVREETGLEFEPTGLLGIYSLARKDLTDSAGTMPHALKLIFVGNAKQGKAVFDTSEIAELGWFTPEEINKMDKGELRDLDIKKEVKDFVDGKRYPLEIITQTFTE